MPSFIGFGLALQSVTVVTSTNLLVRFTNIPLQTSSSGTHDALNPANYSVTGPVPVTVKSCAITGDPRNISLTLQNPIITGSYNLTVVNIQTPAAAVLIAPTTLTFPVNLLAVMSPLSLGAQNDDNEDLLRRYLSPALKGKGWDAILAAIATGDKYTHDLGQQAFEQLFKSSASGIFLDRRASNDGIRRPVNVGMGDDVFRKLVIKTTANKLAIDVILEVLETFYGSDATRANSLSLLPEPYLLKDGDSLVIQTNKNPPVTVTFSTGDFSQIYAATALEAASVITRTFSTLGYTAYALPFFDPSTGLTSVRIFSGGLGLSGVVTVLGGSTQNTFQFPTPVHLLTSDGPQPTTQFTITEGTDSNGIRSGTVRFAWTGTGTNPDLIKVQVGDYVCIYGNTFNVSFRDTYSVSNVGVLSTTSAYFDIINTRLDWAASVTLATNMDVRFYRPTHMNLTRLSRWSSAIQGDPSVLDVILPTTTEAVNRGLNTGAYLHVGTSLALSALASVSGVVTGTTSINHGLSPGDQVFIDKAYPVITPLTPAWTSVSTAYQWDSSASIVLPNGKVLVCGGTDYSSAAYNDTWIFDPTTNGYSSGPPMINVVYWHSLVLLPSGKVLCIGGNNYVADIVNCALYDYMSNTWTQTGSCLYKHTNANVALLPNGKVLAVNGNSWTGTDGQSELYNPATGTWAATGAQPSTKRVVAGSSLLADGRFMVAGGITSVSSPNAVATTDIYNPYTDTWVTGGNLHTARSFFLTIDIPTGTSGKILAVGGQSNATTYLTSAETFNPATLQWTTVSPPGIAHWGGSICKTATSQIAVIGGANSGSLVAGKVEFYDYINDIWIQQPPLSMSTWYFGVVNLLNDGRIFVAGSQAATTVEYYTYTSTPTAVGRLNGMYQVATTPSSTQFTLATPNIYPTTFSTTNATVTPFKAPTNSIQGPFVYDTQSSTPITGVTATSTDAFVIGENYSVLHVNSGGAASFPDAPGWLVFGFGTSSQVGPVKYLGRASSSSLLLDPSYTFPKSVPVGASVTLLFQRGSWVPSAPESVGTFYVTGAAAGRIAASQTIDELVAAGLNVVKTIVYPGDVGLGNAGFPAHGSTKLSDKVLVWGGDEPDSDIAGLRST